jgi:putative ABC transport system permease protein
LRLVSATINVIYFRVDAAALAITPLLIMKASALGIGATLMAVILPAWEASKGSVTSAISRSQLETKVKKLSMKAGLAGLLLIASGLILALSSGKSISLGLSSIFLLLSGFALMTPSITLLIMNMTEHLLGRLFGLLGKLPPRMVCADLSRTGIAIAALMIAIAATIGMDLMINSFRQTVSQWVKASLRADLYVSLPGNNASSIKANADLILKNKIAALPNVQMLSSVLHTKVITNVGMIPLSVFELNKRSKSGFVFKQTLNKTVWDGFEKKPTLFITEPYAYHHQIKVGEYLDLKTTNGKQAFQVIGIYADYSGDQGHLAISRNNYARYWQNSGFTGIGVYSHPSVDINRLQNTIRALLTANQSIRSDQAIYTASMDVFEQTFAITDALRWLAAGIAFVGVFSALMALQFERTQQLGVLRAIGITPRQLTTLIITETGLIGLVAGVLAIPVGYMVAYVLIFVIYQRSFGWTMEFYLNYAVFYQGLALAFVAALLAGIIPALKMARTKPAEALRTE